MLLFCAFVHSYALTQLEEVGGDQLCRNVYDNESLFSLQLI